MKHWWLRLRWGSVTGYLLAKSIIWSLDSDEGSYYPACAEAYKRGWLLEVGGIRLNRRLTKLILRSYAEARLRDEIARIAGRLPKIPIELLPKSPPPPPRVEYGPP